MGTHEVPFGVDRSVLRLDRQDPYLCLHFVIIFVRDQDRSLRFYVDKLGFRVVVDHRFENGQRWMSHPGIASGYSSMYVRSPDAKIAAIVLSNQGASDPGFVINSMLNEVMNP